ncbi:hypothetical protein B4U80_06139, partial [Leptotrombidium deliense]
FISLLANGVKIHRKLIPHLFDMSTSKFLLLDCDYKYDQNDFKLVVRWFHNNTPEPIYQWIPEKQIRHVSEFFKPHFDMKYEADSNDPYTKYRAIRIKNPTPSMSGKYVCVISSLADQVSDSGEVSIYASPKSFDFYSRFNEETGDLQLECNAKDVFPIPMLTLSQNTTVSIAFKRSNVQSSSALNENTSIRSKENSSLFDISVKHTINKDDLLKTVSSRFEMVFECDLHIPNTNYGKSKKITLYSSEYLRIHIYMYILPSISILQMHVH